MCNCKKEPFNLVDLIRRHDAISVVTPSASRNLLHKGQISGVRDFLKELPIERLADPTKFSQVLDSVTDKLITAPREQGRLKGGWGAARKFLNLYLRRITNNFYLRDAYALDGIEHLLELPMDSNAAEGLERYYAGKLPPWHGVSKLTPDANLAYQKAAQQIAECWSTKRVHLDMKFWRPELDDQSNAGSG
jgi:hypothetical protein